MMWRCVSNISGLLEQYAESAWPALSGTRVAFDPVDFIARLAALA
jgi:hypothetical protein